MRFFKLNTQSVVSIDPTPGAGLFISHGIGRHITRRFPPREHEIIFVRAGHLHIREEGEHFDVGPGEALLLWPNLLHSGTADYAIDLQFYWMHFYAEEWEGNQPGILQIPQHCHVIRPQIMEMYFRRYLNDMSEQRLSPIAASSLVTLILTELAVGPTGSTSATSPNIIAARAYAHIQSHLHMPLSTSTIAKEMNCSAGYLSRAFRSAYGRTIVEVIHAERIIHSQKLIVNTNFDIETIAAESGFPSPSYFIKLFKRHTGMTPLAYRRLHSRMYVNMEFAKDS